MALTKLKKQAPKSTRVTVELLDRREQCEPVLMHERFPVPEKVEDHKRGWGEIADLLAKYLE